MGKHMYPTWYEFKKELQEKLGRPVLNEEWLNLKPQKSLPWDEFNMMSVLSKCNKSKLHNKS